MRINRKGFTLTEVLLGLMIVGIIGISLAALTTSASRDSGKSSSKIMLRNNLSIFLRQLRQDIHDSNRVYSIVGNIDNTANTDILVLTQNQTLSETTIRSGDVQYITYCYIKAPTNVEGTNWYIGGQIKRLQNANAKGNCISNGKVVLNNVKYIVQDGKKYPSFTASGSDLKTLLSVKLLLEIPSKPVINDVIEDVIMLPNGF